MQCNSGTSPHKVQLNFARVVVAFELLQMPEDDLRSARSARGCRTS